MDRCYTSNAFARWFSNCRASTTSGSRGVPRRRSKFLENVIVKLCRSHKCHSCVHIPLFRPCPGSLHWATQGVVLAAVRQTSRRSGWDTRGVTAIDLSARRIVWTPNGLFFPLCWCLSVSRIFHAGLLNCRLHAVLCHWNSWKMISALANRAEGHFLHRWTKIENIKARFKVGKTALCGVVGIPFPVS